MELNTDYGLIQGIPFFKNLKTDDLLCIMRYTSMHSLAYGDYLFSQEDPSDGLYVLLSGKLKVSMFGSRVGDQSIVLAEVLPGQYVGEFGVFDGHPRSASVSALEFSKVLFLPAKAFEVILITQPLIAKFVMNNLCELVIKQPQLKILNAKVWGMIQTKALEANLKNMRTLCEIVRENNKSVAHNQRTAKGIRTRPL
ncbi:MAG: cyclic nucleotide-binding domain-containing protein [Gammaproteobacteria bacterium]|nr:cyclic nucleotide-binding domain-containing protein [Gammaproteobacteria bacterium]